MSKYECNACDAKIPCHFDDGNVAGREPEFCPANMQDVAAWVQVQAPGCSENTEQLPKLTAEVFNRLDCPEWANWAAVNKYGVAIWFPAKPRPADAAFWVIGDLTSHLYEIMIIPGEWDASDWEHSLIERPLETMPKLEEQTGRLTVRFKKLHPDAKAPYQATPGSAGFDLTATSVEPVEEDDFLCRYGTGLAVEIPQGHVGLVFPRSSVYKTGQLLTNCVGVIDSDYRGEITAVFVGKCTGNNAYQPGERIAQLVIMPVPAVEFVEADELSETERGAGGYGSTGK